MSKITGNEPAAASKELLGYSEGTPGFIYHTGLTIRQHFASMNIQGMLSNSRIELTEFEKMIELAVVFADMLIEELNKTQQKE